MFEIFSLISCTYSFILFAFAFVKCERHLRYTPSPLSGAHNIYLWPLMIMGCAPLLGPISFIFIEFSAKILQIIGFCLKFSGWRHPLDWEILDPPLGWGWGWGSFIIYLKLDFRLYCFDTGSRQSPPKHILHPTTPLNDHLPKDSSDDPSQCLFPMTPWWPPQGYPHNNP